MLVTLDGISILVNPLQSLNAASPMLVTLGGISILVNPLQPSNAYPPISVTLDGIFVFLQPCIRVFVAFSIMALQLSLLS